MPTSLKTLSFPKSSLAIPLSSEMIRRAFVISVDDPWFSASDARFAIGGSLLATACSTLGVASGVGDFVLTSFESEAFTKSEGLAPC